MTGGVKSGKAQNEHMFSALPPKADIRSARAGLGNPHHIDKSTRKSLCRSAFCALTASHRISLFLT